MTREFVTAHFAISSLFHSYADEARIYCFTVQQEDRQLFTVGKTRLATGRIKITFEITRSSDVLTYAVFHTGDHTINCAVREDGDKEGYAKMVEQLRAPFEKGDFAEMIRVMDRHFGPIHYAIEHLFRDEQRHILDQILASSRDEIYTTLRHITDHYAPLRRFMASFKTPSLKPLGMATEIVLNTELRRQFESDTLDKELVRSLVAECAASNISLYKGEISYAFKEHLERASDRFSLARADMDALQKFLDAADLMGNLPFEINLWKPQNTYYDALKTALPEMQHCAAGNNEQAKAWVEKFLALGEKLGFAGMAQPK